MIRKFYHTRNKRAFRNTKTFVKSNIFANPSLGIDIRTQATQLSTVNQSASILLTQLASTAAGVAALSQISGVDSILSVLKSGQGLVSEIQGAANLLDQAKNLPGVGALLSDIPGSGEVLAGLQEYGTAIFTEGFDALGIDINAITNFDVSELLGGSEQVIEIAQEYAAEAFEFIASFW